jgi:hypothetical protein
VGTVIAKAIATLEALHCSGLMKILSKIVSTVYEYVDKIMGDVLSPLLFNFAPENFIEALQCSELNILSKIVSTVYMDKITGDVTYVTSHEMCATIEI